MQQSLVAESRLRYCCSINAPPASASPLAAGSSTAHLLFSHAPAFKLIRISADAVLCDQQTWLLFCKQIHMASDLPGITSEGRQLQSAAPDKLLGT